MYEFELKFQVLKLPKGFKKLQYKNTFSEIDYYYDTHNYDLIKNGNFLRVRNNKNIDFKLDVGDDFHLYCKETSFKKDNINCQNNEYIKIFEYLNIEINNNFNNFDEFVKYNHFILIAPICKKRSIYLLDENTTITLDFVENIGIFMEVEKMFNEIIDIDDKIKVKHEILNMLEYNNLIDVNTIEQHIGYVELYLKENNHNIYELGKFKM